MCCGVKKECCVWYVLSFVKTETWNTPTTKQDMMTQRKRYCYKTTNWLKTQPWHKTTNKRQHTSDTMNHSRVPRCYSKATCQCHQSGYKIHFSSCLLVPAGSPSRGRDATIYVLDLNQPNLPTPFYSVFVPVSVFMALSTVFHSINSPDNYPLSDFVLMVLSCLLVPLNYVSLFESLPQPWYDPLWLTGLKAPTN